ncbi:sugar ABC transporter ATP-binding protein [Ameyamaea chiangmaiensis NBRC 103196]|uniref:Sugar ABC transporter ATP-binding protein n=1 Tax=Ameyamaea chiangmaiensis TaxID=442969 RepID=A0A850PFP3_9PROT|nr:sugar ABC transporter ATP-binding protein [Ameyamaea chiangmaiensis]MBS4074140.1 sugar ABC transporter ATP-binding protein [Ameyamaea chiangmaiensis]NVN39951.1 sugar ABC transporter ATP-binding protein [Ameyamaea chiangmaiensis]GBQ71015.1 sugar ABC transporter ATP-binding protein [Ameyamaea chiangmaiensis NBRC 103196]
MTAPLLELRDVVRHFGGVKALDGVSLSIMPGEIHCLAGENGSGKSTLIKIVSGVNTIDRGHILVDGTLVDTMTPRLAIAHGIQVIYQDFSLFGNLTVAENLALGAEVRAGRRLVNWRRMRAHAQAAVDRLGVALDLDATVDSLPTSGRQLVAIARALMADPLLLIMDEPTTTLTSREVAALFDVVRDIQSRGIAVLFVSHKMREMLAISERITILRSGLVVAGGPIGQFDEAGITRLMTGSEIAEDPYLWDASPATHPVLAVRDLSVRGVLHDINLTIGAGEIVGVSGLLGSGRTELALALFGLLPSYTGTVQIDGRDVALRSVRHAIANRIAYVPEDRLTEGLFLPESIDINLLCASFDRLSRGGVLRPEAMRDAAASAIRDMAIATPTGERPVVELSGGNQQRVVIGRWLLRHPRILILNGPTVGVDVGSKAGIHRTVRRLAREHGMAVIMISDDLPELIGNCNRVLVMHRGRLVDEVADTRNGPYETRRAERALSDRLRELA